MALNTIKRVIDIHETEECQRVFALVFRDNQELKERLFSFTMTEEDADKTTFLKTLCRQLANNACTADAVSMLYITYMLGYTICWTSKIKVKFINKFRNYFIMYRNIMLIYQKLENLIRS